MTVNGRSARYYVVDDRRAPDRFWMPVTYHRQVGGRLRQMTVSPKLLRRMLREPVAK